MAATISSREVTRSQSVCRDSVSLAPSSKTMEVRRGLRDRETAATATMATTAATTITPATIPAMEALDPAALESELLSEVDPSGFPDAEELVVGAAVTTVP